MEEKKQPVKLYMRDLRIEDEDVPKKNKEGEAIVISIQADLFPDWWISDGSRKCYFLVKSSELDKLDPIKRTSMLDRLEKIRIANMSKSQRQVEDMRKEIEGEYDVKLKKELAKIRAEMKRSTEKKG